MLANLRAQTAEETLMVTVMIIVFATWGAYLTKSYGGEESAVFAARMFLQVKTFEKACELGKPVFVEYLYYDWEDGNLAIKVKFFPKNPFTSQELQKLAQELGERLARFGARLEKFEVIE